MLNISEEFLYFFEAKTGPFSTLDRRQGRDEENNHADTDEPRLEKQWTDAVTVPLLYAYTSRYLPGTDKMRCVNNTGFDSNYVT